MSPLILKYMERIMCQLKFKSNINNNKGINNLEKKKGKKYLRIYV